MDSPRFAALAPAAFVALVGCTGEEPAISAPPGPLGCAAGRELFRDACVDPAQRYEPAARVDHDNVAAYGDPLTQLNGRVQPGE